MRNRAVFLFILLLNISPYLHADSWLNFAYNQNPLQQTLATDGKNAVHPYQKIVFPALLPKQSLFSFKSELDTTRKYLHFKYVLNDKIFNLPVVWSVEDYTQAKLKYEFSQALKKKFLVNLERQRLDKGTGLELKVPVRFKSKTFRRIFGGDQVGLRVTGNLSLEMAGRVNKYPGALSSAAQRSSVFSPKFKQSQQFQIQGNIGEKVTVSVQQNSEATFDFENTLKVNYDGDEDEIIQSIQAGNVSLNLPGTRYVSGSSSSAGLFGLKADFQIGKLSLTTIASLEKGEKNKKSLKGGVEERPIEKYDYDYVKNQFFFVDSFYIPYFENWTINMDWIRADEIASKQIVDLEVWVSVGQNQQDEAPRQGVAALDPEPYYDIESPNNAPTIQGEIETGYFKRLEEDIDYKYDENRGFFYLLRRTLQDNEVLGIAYRLQDGSKRGTLVSDLDSSSVLVLKLIKPRSLNPSYKRAWKLMMKNVYDLGSNIPNDFNLDIVLYRDGSDQNVQPKSPNKPFINLLGLDRRDAQDSGLPEGDGKVDITNGNIFLKGIGKLIFPTLEPFNPPDTSMFKDLHPDYRADIYGVTDSKKLNQESKFKMVYVSREVSTKFQLGFNVMENSEEVFVNGRKLEKGVGYTIDYFSGELNIIDEAAQAADANIDISYESASLFQLNKKTLLGAHARYQFNEDNYLTFTTMYLNKTTIDDKVRIGQEPTKDFIWDFQSVVKKDSRLITKMLNNLPFVNTDQTSSFSMEFEMAQIRPNPNTRNNEKTGDNDGVAYVDDFEGAERATTLGVGQRIWTPASIPEVFAVPEYGVEEQITYLNPDKMFEYDSNRVHLNWYIINANIKDIWPDREVSARTGSVTSVLQLRWHNTRKIPSDKAWWGIMRSTKNFPDQQRTKYIELWVKTESDAKARLNIDLGMINEDWYIRGNYTDNQGNLVPSIRNLNTEDKNNTGFLEEDEDVGLDGVAGNDDDPNRPANDAGDDDYKGYNETPIPFYNVNGTEGNSRAAGERYPDTEDIDKDGNLNLINSYVEYSVSLDPNDEESKKYFVGETETGWKLIRIPIKDYVRTVGNPDTTFQRVYFVRLWMNNLEADDSLHAMNIASFDFVGYEWESIGLAKDDSTEFDGNDSLMQVTVYNTEENTVSIEGGPEPYHAPPGVEGAYDRVNNIRTKEQSLVLRALKLEPGELGAAEKFLSGGQKYDLSQYKKFKLFVHGDWDLPAEDSPLEFRFRFGHAPESYYEVIEKITPHWDDNTMEIDLDELTATKNDKYLINPTKMIFERNITIGNKEFIYRVVGNPNVNNIAYIRYILHNTGETTLEDLEVWVDELRAADARKDPGSAIRLAPKFNLANLISYTGQMESKDADFHQLGQTTNAGSKTTEVVSHNLQINTHNFLPSDWKLLIPVSIRYNQTKYIPKFYKSTDRHTEYEYSSLLDRIYALLGNKKINAELQSEIDFNESFGYSVSFKRSTGPKDPWYVKYTLNQMSIQYNYSNINSHNFNYAFINSEKEDFSTSYTIPFGRNNFFTPLSMLKNVPLMSRFNKYRLYYTPSNFSTSFAASRNFEEKKTRLGDDISSNKSLLTSRSVSLNYKLTDDIDFSIKRDYAADATPKAENVGQLLRERLLNGDFGTTTRTGQQFRVDYKPRRWFSFFTPNYSFNSNYNYTFGQSNSARNATLVRTNKVSGTLNLDRLMELIWKPKKGKPAKGQRSKSKRPTRGLNQGNDDSTNDSDNNSGFKAKLSLNPVKLFLYPIWRTLYMMKSIRMDYTISDNANYVNIDDVPEWEFQFGLKTSADVNPDTTQRKIIVPKRWDHREQFTSGVQFNPIREIRISLDYNQQKSRSFNNDVFTTSKKNNYLLTGDEINKENELLNYIPNWKISISGIEKYFGLKKYFTSINLDHSRTGDHTENLKEINGEFSPQGETFTTQYQPFLRLNTRLKWNVDVSFGYNKSLSYTTNPSGGDTRGTSSSLTFNASFQKTGGFVLPFLKNKKLKNDVRFGLQIQMNNKQNFVKSPLASKFEELNSTASFSFQPSINYRFSNNVVGEFFLLSSSQEDKRLGKSSQFEMGLKVNITLR